MFALSVPSIYTVKSSAAVGPQSNRRSCAHFPVHAVSGTVSNSLSFNNRKSALRKAEFQGVRTLSGLQALRTRAVRKPLVCRADEDESTTITDQQVASVESCREILLDAVATKKTDGDKVVDALLDLEKIMRAKAKDDADVAADVLANLDGAWRLVFTTGTIDTQKKFGRRVNYFPVKAAQCFDTETMTLTNGIYIGDFAVLKFFGPFEFNLKSRKLEFDFYDIAVLGFKFSLGRGGAADIGQATGLGSNNNKKLVEAGKKPFFNWISADSDIATARGGGGGIALWSRDTDMQAINAAEKAKAN